MERNKLLCGDVPSIQLTTLLHDIRTAMWDNQETLENEVEEAAVAHTPSSVRLTTVSRSQQTDEDLCSQTLARTDRTFAAPGEPACPRSVGRCAASAMTAEAAPASTEGGGTPEVRSAMRVVKPWWWLSDEEVASSTGPPPVQTGGAPGDSEEGSAANQDTSETISQLLQKLAEGLSSLQKSAGNAPPSSVANAQYERDKRELEEAKATIKALKAHNVQLYRTSDDEHKALLDQHPMRPLTATLGGRQDTSQDIVEESTGNLLETLYEMDNAVGRACQQAQRIGIPAPPMAGTEMMHAAEMAAAEIAATTTGLVATETATVESKAGLSRTQRLESWHSDSADVDLTEQLVIDPVQRLVVDIAVSSMEEAVMKAITSQEASIRADKHLYIAELAGTRHTATPGSPQWPDRNGAHASAETVGELLKSGIRSFEFSPAARAESIQSWQDRLEAGETSEPEPMQHSLFPPNDFASSQAAIEKATQQTSAQNDPFSVAFDVPQTDIDPAAPTTGAKPPLPAAPGRQYATVFAPPEFDAFSTPFDASAGFSDAFSAPFDSSEFNAFPTAFESSKLNAFSIPFEETN